MIRTIFNFRKGGEINRLVMAMICRDEIEIIEANIRVHAALGVDAFVIMDNGSKDGTREILHKMSEEYEILIIDNQDVMQQKVWMLDLCKIAKKNLKADLVICNDADEFWFPLDQKQGLKKYLKYSDSIVTVQRANMLPTNILQNQNVHFTDYIHRIANPVLYSKDERCFNDSININLGSVTGKVIVQPLGLTHIVRGNHRARHVFKRFSARIEPNIRIYHYPIATYDRFYRHVQFRLAMIKLKMRVGTQYRRWLRLLEQGRLEEEFSRLAIQSEHLSTLIENHIVEKDVLAQQIFKQHLAN